MFLLHHWSNNSDAQCRMRKTGVNGRGRSDDGRDVWDIPVTRRLGIPASGGELKAVDVPVAALLQHQTMCLDTVKVRLSLNTQVECPPRRSGVYF